MGAIETIYLDHRCKQVQRENFDGLTQLGAPPTSPENEGVSEIIVGERIRTMKCVQEESRASIQDCHGGTNASICANNGCRSCNWVRVEGQCQGKSVNKAGLRSACFQRLMISFMIDKSELILLRIVHSAVLFLSLGANDEPIASS